MRLMPGIYSFKFVVDGVWMVDSNLMCAEDTEGNLNNVMKVKVFNNQRGKFYFRRKRVDSKTESICKI
jgi:hypothetical protein